MPRPAEAEPRLMFEEFALVRLGRPRPFRQPVCMPAGVVMPRRSARSCCWYHGGDWHAVSALALAVLRCARAQGVDGDGMKDFATDRAVAAGVTEWQAEALATWFSVGDAIQPGSQGGYVNGQHRAQAMLEAGVRRMVVLRYVYEALALAGRTGCRLRSAGPRVSRCAAMSRRSPRLRSARDTSRAFCLAVPVVRRLGPARIL